MLYSAQAPACPTEAALTALFEVEELEQRLENDGWDIHLGPGGVVIDYPFELGI